MTGSGTTTPGRAPDPTRRPSAEHDRVFWTSVVVGAGMAAVGVLALAEDTERTRPLATFGRFVAVLVLHDLLLLPVVFGIGYVTMRVTPPSWRAPVRAGLLISAVVLLIAAWGIAAQHIEVQPGNRHVLPNDYRASVAWLLAPVWTAVLIWGLRARRRQHGSRGAVEDEDAGAG